MHEIRQGAFTAEVLAAGQGGGHAVVVPKEIAAAFDSKRPPVLAHVNGVEYRSRLMVYGGQSSSACARTLRQLGVGPGDQIEIELVGIIRSESSSSRLSLPRRWQTTRQPRPRTRNCPLRTAMSTRAGSMREKSPRPALIGSPRQSDG
jgi:hypothetical protein